MQEEVAHYISRAREYGLSDDEISKHLMQAGWPDSSIQEAFAVFEDYEKHTLDVSNPSFHPSIQVSNRVVSPEVKTEPLIFQSKPRKWKKILFGSLAAVIAILLLSFLIIFKNFNVLGFSFFNFVISRSAGTSANINFEDFNIAYADSGSFESPALGNGIAAFKLQNAQFSAETKNTKDSSGSRAGEINFSAANNGSDYQNKLTYEYINKTLYLKIDESGQTKFVTDFLNKNLGQDITGQWLKLKMSGDQSSLTTDGSIKYQELLKELLQKKIVTAHVAGFEKVNSHYSIHYKLAVDKPALEKFVLDQIPTNDSAPTQLTSAQEKDAITAIVEKLNLNQLDIWAGLNDLRINRIKFQSSAPSLAEAAKYGINNYSQSIAKSGDNKRIADIKALQQSLELFYNDNKGYPASDNGKPTDLFTKYMPEMPTAPPPTGNCSDYYNDYWYSTQGKATTSPKSLTVYPTFKLTFCLGQDTAGLSAGLGTLNQEGIVTTLSCPNTEHPCFIEENRQANSQESFSSMISKVNFSANLNFDFIFGNNSQISPIVEPQDSLDVSAAIGTASSLSPSTSQ